MLDLNVMTRANRDDVLSQEVMETFGRNFWGELIREGESGYDQARAIWNGLIDRRPALIARCTGAADVVEAVDFARANNLLVSVRGGGHNVAGTALCDGGLLIDLSPLKGIHVDPRARTARVQPGVTLGELDRETQLFGLVTPTGVVSKTGIAGLTLGGGFGWLSRKYGLTCDNLISADVVTADGRLVTAGPTENADLFWGLRGGGGNFGIVTTFQFRLHPLDPLVLSGPLLYPLENAGDALRFYREFAAQAPDELGSLVVFHTAPPAPFVPEEYHGRPVLGLIFCYAGPVEEGRRVIQPMRGFGSPLADLIEPKPFTAHQSALDHGQEPGPYRYWKSEYLPGLSDDAIETCIAYGASKTSPETKVLLFHLGGAVSRMAEQDSAAGHRDAVFALNIAAAWTERQESNRHIQWTRDFWTAMQPFSTGGGYVNFISADEGQERVRAAYGPHKYRRLGALKNKYDPDNFFRVNQNIRADV